MEEDHKISITSFNKYPEMIELFLDKLELSKENRGKINVICGFPEDMQKGKKEHIEKAKEISRVKDNSEVILVDDDKKNIEQAKQSGIAGLLVDKKILIGGNTIAIIKATKEAFQAINNQEALKTTIENKQPDNVSFKLQPPSKKRREGNLPNR